MMGGEIDMEVSTPLKNATSFQANSKLDADGGSNGSKTLTIPTFHFSRSIVQPRSLLEAGAREPDKNIYFHLRIENDDINLDVKIKDCDTKCN
jgi:hypothetical protein